MKKNQDKMYIVRKFVKADSVASAIRKEKSVKPHEVFVDDEWRKANTDKLADAIGFHLPTTEDEE